MPELPEVETIRQSLNKIIINKRIIKTIIHRPKIVASNSNKRKVSPQKTAELMIGVENQNILSIKRIAKHLIIELSSGYLLIHLKMTGQLLYSSDSNSKFLNKHTCVEFYLDDGSLLLYNDIRQFGYVLYFTNYQELIDSNCIKDYGSDPYLEELIFEVIYNGYQKKNKTFKQVCLEQSVICGLGNIYADEVAFASKILPTRISKTLTKDEVTKVIKESKRIVSLAVASGGSSVSDYTDGEGQNGSYQNYHLVYGRKGKECKNCQNILEHTKLAGRMTVFCKVCQK